MRLRSALISFALLTLLAPAAGASSPLGDMPRVRPLGDRALSLVAEAREKSQTVRDLLKGLEDRDVIAYVKVVPAVEGEARSTVRYVGTSHLSRFLLIEVEGSDQPCRQVERLAHELQHVSDVAGRAWVTSDAQLQRMFVMTGRADRGSGRGYETPTAMRAESRARRELRALGEPRE